MEQLNKVELKGIVGNVKAEQIANKTICRFTLCTNYAYVNEDGGAVIDTMWHNVTWFGDTEIKRGDKLHVIGRIRYNAFVGEDGQRHYATDILANKVNLILTDNLKAQTK